MRMPFGPTMADEPITAPIRVGLFLPPLKLTAGVARYISGLLEGLVELADPRFEFVVFTNLTVPTYRLPMTSSRLRVVDTSLAAARTGVRILNEHFRLWSLLRRHRIDLYHGLNNVVPVYCPCPSVVTVHDLTYLRFPEVHTLAKKMYWGYSVANSVRRAAQVLAISEATRDDLVHYLQVRPESIVVAPHGATEWPPDDESHSLSKEFGIAPGTYILNVGTLEPRKNLVTLLRAYKALRTNAEIKHKLVIVGGRGWHCEAWERQLSEIDCREDVIVTGFVPDGALRRIYTEAAAFVYPSLFEGFGLPVLEALGCGTPTITSNVSAMPEVAGDAAILVDPTDVGQLADAIYAVLTDRSLAARLRAAGPARAALFNWRQTAQQTLLAYEAAIPVDSMAETSI